MENDFYKDFPQDPNEEICIEMPMEPEEPKYKVAEKKTGYRNALIAAGGTPPVQKDVVAAAAKASIPGPPFDFLPTLSPAAMLRAPILKCIYAYVFLNRPEAAAEHGVPDAACEFLDSCEGTDAFVCKIREIPECRKELEVFLLRDTKIQKWALRAVRSELGDIRMARGGLYISWPRSCTFYYTFDTGD